jgi:integrase
MSKLILTVNQIFKQAYIDAKIHNNPTLNIIVPKMEENTGRALTDIERKYVLEVAKTHRYGRWIRGMMYLGYRPGETAIIQGKDIDFETMTLHIRGTKSRKANRYVPIPEFLIDDFRGFSKEEYLYTTLAGNPPDEQRRTAWWHAFKRDLDIAMGAKVYRNQIIESVVAEDLTAYCLRHTYGTDGQAAGIPIDVLADLMGHESVTTTRKYYIHDNQESRDKARQAMELFYESKNA